jgi:hypothetical protein
VTSIIYMNQEFYRQYERFINFDYDVYKEIVEKRTSNRAGIIKGSELIIEVATLAMFFASKRVKEQIIIFDACNFAFWGWKLSHELLEMGASDDEIVEALGNAIIEIKKYFDEYHINIEKQEIEWLIYCCALIKKELYQEFEYKMIALMLDGDEEKVEVVFSTLGQRGDGYDLSNYISTPITNELKKIGRNELCVCGSGKKYKKCCLTKYE